jgi:hypothetical protein
VVIEHDVVKQGAKTKHQIDVYWEYTLGGIEVLRLDYGALP